MVWYSHLLKNFPQFVVIRMVKGFDTVNKAEICAFLGLSCFFSEPQSAPSLVFADCIELLHLWLQRI